MTLRSTLFRGNPRVARAAENAPPFQQGETSGGVGLLQAGLIRVGYPMPISTRRRHGAPDGIFGSETTSTVQSFQAAQQGLAVDGIAGRQTLTRLDSLLPHRHQVRRPPVRRPPPPRHAPTPPPPSAPPPTAPVIPVSPDFKLGADDPRMTPDAGAGAWNSTPKEIGTIAMYAVLSDLRFLAAAAATVGDDAAVHLSHYFANTGRPLSIDLEGMVAEVPSAMPLYITEVDLLRAYVETLPPGVYDITSKHGWTGYNYQSESRNWFFAVGGYTTWVKGRVSVGAGASPICTIALEYKFFDRYNWDGGKSVTIAGITITDEFMGEFHRQGLAKEYDEVGSFRRSLSWTKGAPIPPAQITTPGGR